MGFSMGASQACHLAGRGEAGPRELILFYGGQPPEGDIRARKVSLHLAPGDEWFTDTKVLATEEAVTSAGAEVTAYQYPGSGHWFAERGAPEFDERAAGLARSRVLDQLRP
jgi:carboxymethylenebutenolidase